MLYSGDVDAFEINFWNEIWGCVKYIKLPYDTVMNMPVQDRKLWIRKHNMETAQENEKSKKNNEEGSILSGEMLNSFAGLEQSNEDI